MNRLSYLLFFILIGFSSSLTPCWSQQTLPDTFTELYVASTPCGHAARPLPGMDVSVPCEFMKWNLLLRRDSLSGRPTRFKLGCIYGLTLPGTTGFTGGGRNLELEGKWDNVKGTAENTAAEVYRLLPDNSREPIYFLKLSDSLLHLLDTKKRLMIGNPGWSYTFNRIR